MSVQILIVDDEIRDNDSIVDELKLAEYRVEVIRNIDIAWQYLASHIKDIDLLILDIMMPPGELFRSADTEFGLRSGVLFFEKLRRDAASELPVVILTNISDVAVRERFEREKLCWFMRKEDVLPYDLVLQVDKILRRVD